jgi:hypothetical protein
MRSIRRIGSLALIAALVAAAPAFAQSATPKSAHATAAGGYNPAGKWTGTFQTPHGVMTATFDFKVDGDKVTGTHSAEQMGAESVPVSGTFKDDKVTLSMSANGHSFDLVFTFTDADTMTGHVTTEAGDVTGTVTRVKPEKK